MKVVGEVVANEYAVLDSTREDADKAPAGTVIGSHLDAGKTQEAHQCNLLAAKILAATCLDLIADPQALPRVQEEFQQRKAALEREG